MNHAQNIIAIWYFCTVANILKKVAQSYYMLSYLNLFNADKDGIE